jgi:ABC-2 type transport system permease protein
MPTRNVLTVSRRVYSQLRRDVRTLTLFIISPALVMVVLWGMLADHPDLYARCGLLVAGLFPSAPGFLFASFMVHAERRSGTMEHLLTTPASPGDILVGYVLGFTAPAVVQTVLSLSLALGPLGLDVPGPWWLIGALALLNAALGVVMGVAATLVARTEFQLVLSLPPIALPHLVLSGLFRPYDEMVGWQHAIATVLPWRFAVSGLSELLYHSSVTASLLLNVGIVVGICALLSALSVRTVFQRRTA